MNRRPEPCPTEPPLLVSAGRAAGRSGTRQRESPPRPAHGPEAAGKAPPPGEKPIGPARPQPPPAPQEGAQQEIASALLSWYATHKRNLPWRQTKDPYRIWVSEILLQQTRVDAAIPYYHRFFAQFPTVTDLAQASLEQVLKAWENLGYYARARNLHRAAQLVVARHGGRIPDTHEELCALPGIGRYTAGAILSIAFGRAAPALDANLLRVLARLRAVASPVHTDAARKRLEGIAARLLPPESPGAFNQALMDLGSLVCTPRRPRCLSCPVRGHCRAHAEGLAEALPARKGKKAVPHARVVAALVRDRRGRWLVVQRPPQGLLASLWKFPGGFLRPGEVPADGLARCCAEEVGMAIAAGPLLASVNHAYTHLRITLEAYAGAGNGGRPQAKGCQAWRWVTEKALEALPLSRADRLLARAIVAPEKGTSPAPDETATRRMPGMRTSASGRVRQDRGANEA